MITSVVANESYVCILFVIYLGKLFEEFIIWLLINMGLYIQIALHYFAFFPII